MNTYNLIAVTHIGSWKIFIDRETKETHYCVKYYSQLKKVGDYMIKHKLYETLYISLFQEKIGTVDNNDNNTNVHWLKPFFLILKHI